MTPTSPTLLHSCTAAPQPCRAAAAVALWGCVSTLVTHLAAPSPASQQGSRHCLYSDPSTGDPPLPPPSFGTLETEKLSYSLAGSGGSLRCLSCSEPAGGGRIAHRSLFPPGAGAVFPAHCTSVHSPGCRGFLTEVLQDPMRSLVYRSWTSLPQLCAIWSLQ